MNCPCPETVNCPLHDSALPVDGVEGIRAYRFPRREEVAVSTVELGYGRGVVDREEPGDGHRLILASVTWELDDETHAGPVYRGTWRP